MIKLPCHPESTISDPLSILDSEEVLVPYWDFLKALLNPFVDETGALEEPNARLSQFIDVLETISYSVTGNGSPNFSLLLESASPTQLSRLVGPIVRSALNMKELFPDGVLPTFEDPAVSPKSRSCTENRYISSKGAFTTITLDHAQLSCLLCHMILGTFSKPQWMSWNGPCLGPLWFADDGKGDRRIKTAYIHVLLAFLEEELISLPTTLSNQNGRDLKAVRFSLFDLYGRSGRGESVQPLFQLEDTESSLKSLTPLNVYFLEEEDDDHEPCFTSSPEDNEEICQLVSANKEIGFGPTATQEERIFGSNPNLLPVVLITPPLSGTQSLLITGDTRIYGHFTGHLRSAQLRKIYSSSDRKIQSRIGRSFLFLDALEMDKERQGQDAKMGNMLREIHKLMSGFKALLQRNLENPMDTHHKNGHRLVVIIPPWGCGTFGGDIKVKLLLIWIAASVCGINELRFAVRRDWWHALDVDWRNLIDNMRGMEVHDKARNVGWLWRLLCHLEKASDSSTTFNWLGCWV